MKSKFANIMLKIKGKIKGFTLIEALVALAVFTILVVVFYKIYSETMTHMQDSKYRRGAVALANERMEHLRNLAYENVVVKANASEEQLSNGKYIVDDEIVEVNGLTYRIVASVFYVDDPADGTLNEGTDTLYEDYKRVSVVVFWDKGVNTSISKSDLVNGSQYKSKRIDVISQFVPPGGLETEVTGGVLSINVLDSTVEQIEPLANAEIEIYDRERDTVITGISTDINGNYMYIGAAVCDGCYEVTVRKSGYELRKTMDVFDPSVGDGNAPFEEGEFNPTYVHQGVIVGNITVITFNTNETSQLNMKSQDPFGNGIGDVNFDIIGGEIIGTTVDLGDGIVDDVYGYSAIALSTNGTNDDIDLDTAEDGSYVHTGTYVVSNVTFPTSHADDIFWKLQPTYNSEAYQLNVDADTDVEMNMLILDNDYDGAFIQIVEKMTDEDGDVLIPVEYIPVEGVSVQLQNTTLTPSYDVTLVTDEFGYAYFPEVPVEEDPIVELENEETYDVFVLSSDEYTGIDADYDIDGEDNEVNIDGLTEKILEIVKK